MDFLLAQSMRSRCVSLVDAAHWPWSSQASIVVVHGLSCSAARGIFPDQEQTHVPCTGRRIPIHGTIGEAPKVAYILILICLLWFLFLLPFLLLPSFFLSCSFVDKHSCFCFSSNRGRFSTILRDSEESF